MFFFGGGALPLGTPFWDPLWGSPLLGHPLVGTAFWGHPIWEPLWGPPLWGSLHLGPLRGTPPYGTLFWGTLLWCSPLLGPPFGAPPFGVPLGATLTLHLAGRLPNGLRAAVPAGAASWSFSGVAPQSWRGGGGVEETSPRLERLLAEKVTFHPFFWGAGRPDVAGLPASSRFGGCRSVRVFSSLRLAKI